MTTSTNAQVPGPPENPHNTYIDQVEFARLLSIGHGRPLLYLRDHDPAPYQDAILHACLTDQRYDGCEPVRERYVLDLIRLSQNSAAIAAAMVQALASAGKDDEYQQLFSVAVQFATHGHTGLADGVLSAVDRLAGQGDLDAVEYAIQLEGVGPILRYVKPLAAQEPEDDHWTFGHWICLLEEQYGEQAAWDSLRCEAKSNAALEKMLQGKLPDLERVAEYRERPPRELQDYSQVKRFIDGGESGIVLLRKWGASADPESLLAAARDLLSEDDPGRLMKFCRIFSKRAFPLELDRLIELATSVNERLVAGAANVLANVASPKVRNAALEMIEKGERPDVAVDLLRSNYRHGDFEMVCTLFDREMDIDVLHWLGLSIRHLVEANMATEAIPPLLRLYDVGPCGLCRHGAVELLAKLGGLTDTIRQECVYDAYESTRELAHSTPATC